MAQSFMGNANQGAPAQPTESASESPLAGLLGNPAVLESLRNDPVLAPVLEDVQANGPNAMFKYAMPTIYFFFGSLAVL